MAEYICGFNTVGVPSDFIERVMPKLNGTFVKVYLFALNLASRGKNMSDLEIAEALDLLESDVVKAFDALEERGCLRRTDGFVIFGAAPADMTDLTERAEESAAADAEEEADGGEREKKSAESIKSIIEGNRTLAELCQLAQQTLGRTLSDSDIETLYWFYDGLGFSPEVILMILEYCVSKDKRSMKYIEKVAIGWHENGVTTIDAAEKYMNEMQEKNSFSGNMRRLFGIDRPFSKTEETYLKTWRDSYGMSGDMIALAYEYCIINTGKLSFPYMNSIVENWFKKDIFTVPDAEKEHAAHKAGTYSGEETKESETRRGEKGLNYDKIEEIMRKKYGG